MSTTLSKLREYETMLVLNPELTDDQAAETLDRLKEVLTRMKAELLREDRWGKKKLAYEVKKQMRGHYVLFHYVGEVGVVEELERMARNMENVYRFLTTMAGEVRDIEAKRAEVERMVKERAEKQRAAEKREERGDEEAPADPAPAASREASA